MLPGSTLHPPKLDQMMSWILLESSSKPKTDKTHHKDSNQTNCNNFGDLFHVAFWNAVAQIDGDHKWKQPSLLHRGEHAPSVLLSISVNCNLLSIFLTLPLKAHHAIFSITTWWYMESLVLKVYRFWEDKQLVLQKLVNAREISSVLKQNSCVITWRRVSELELQCYSC